MQVTNRMYQSYFRIIASRKQMFFKLNKLLNDNFFLYVHNFFKLTSGCILKFLLEY